MVKDVVAAYGHIDILVNNAGIWPTENILDMPDSNWEKVIRINLNGPFLLCKRVAKHMVDAGIKGSIINLSSKSGITYNTGGHAHYASAKAGDQHDDQDPGPRAPARTASARTPLPRGWSARRSTRTSGPTPS